MSKIKKIWIFGFFVGFLLDHWNLDWIFSVQSYPIIQQKSKFFGFLTLNVDLKSNISIIHPIQNPEKN
jgi:hypothetical protein